ncbi:MAG: hypothetical protein VX733_01980 [Candidatus Latescibacterota bacterium]|nr:hypothetical protein [Candidatus Latescibacterota bacterium]
MRKARITKAEKTRAPKKAGDWDGQPGVIDSRIKFCLLFCLGLAGLMWIFVSCEAWFGSYYLWPISWTAASLIDLFDVSVLVYAPPDQESLCILEIGRVVFHVEYQCSGISAFFIYLAALFAYPAKSGHKVRGALIGIPAFFAYGALRLVILGAIAITIPDLLRFFHLYFMVILNLGFVMMLWADWIRKIVEPIAEPAYS